MYNCTFFFSLLFEISSSYNHIYTKEYGDLRMNYELERILELCAQRGWSRYKLAKEMDDNPTSVNNMFHRVSTPSVSTLRRVCAAFGITMSEFYRTEGVSVCLTQDQQQILELYNRLDSRTKELARSYLEGLASAAAPKQPPEEKQS